MAETADLTLEQREKLWEQFVSEHGKAQEDFDPSLRTLAGAGLAVTVSLATALETTTRSGCAPRPARLLEWFQICLRHGWLAGHKTVKQVTLRAKNGVGANGHRGMLFNRRKRRLDLPYGSVAVRCGLCRSFSVGRTQVRSIRSTARAISRASVCT